MNLPKSLDAIEARAKRRKDNPLLRLIAAIRKIDAKNKNELYSGEGPPSVGMDIYIDSSFFIDHGEDDVRGGRAEVLAVKKEHGHYFVEVCELPGHSYNWSSLWRLQPALKKEFKNQRAAPDPDYG